MTLFEAGAAFWLDLKDQVSSGSGISRDGLHIMAGLLGLLGASLLTRRPVSSPIPWLIVVAVTVSNEASDLFTEIWPGKDRERQWAESIHDLWNTLLVPSALMLLARTSQSLFGKMPDGGDNLGAGTVGPAAGSD